MQNLLALVFLTIVLVGSVHGTALAIYGALVSSINNGNYHRSIEERAFSEQVMTVLNPEFAKLFPSHTCTAAPGVSAMALSRLYAGCDNTDNATKIEGQKCTKLFALAAQTLKNASLINHIQVTCDQSSSAPVSRAVFRDYC